VKQTSRLFRGVKRQFRTRSPHLPNKNDHVTLLRCRRSPHGDNQQDFRSCGDTCTTTINHVTRHSAVFGGTSYHNFKKVEEQGPRVDAHPKKRTVPIGEQHATFKLEEVE
jgi:hypothetical protein